MFESRPASAFARKVLSDKCGRMCLFGKENCLKLVVKLLYLVRVVLVFEFIMFFIYKAHYN